MRRRDFIVGAASLPIAAALPVTAAEPELYTATEYYGASTVFTGSVAWTGLKTGADQIIAELMATGDRTDAG